MPSPTIPLDREHEQMVLLQAGSEDIAVCISGFGSARLPVDRWRTVAEVSGRTTYVLRYDAQDLPWSSADVPRTVFEVFSHRGELLRRWRAARLAAVGTSGMLAGWIRRWTDAGKNVLVIGFSLGGYLAWRAVKESAHPLVSVVMVSAAIGDRPSTWSGISSLGRVVNVYSSKDLVLKYLYPSAVDSDETPAVGLGPVQPGGRVAVRNIDVTDLIGADHLWASRNLGRIVRLVFLVMKASSEGIPRARPGLASVLPSSAKLDPAVFARLYLVGLAKPSLWADIGLALRGDLEALSRVNKVDEAVLSNGILEESVLLGLSARGLLHPSPWSEPVAHRQLLELEGNFGSLLQGSLISGEEGDAFHDLDPGR